MKNITIKTVVVNGNVRKIFNEKRKLDEALSDLYKDQGILYEKEFKVSRQDADLAGWHPNDIFFSSSCDGWKKFIADRGKITKKEMIEVISVREAIFPDDFEEEEEEE